jgi:hypothetical protein
MALSDKRSRVILVLPRELAVGLGRPVSFEVTGCVGFPAGAGRDRVSMELAA